MMDLDRLDMWQGSVKLMWVNRYDHRIYYCINEISWKELELTYEGNYSNPHIWIWIIVKLF
jgi:hypothetical protein